MLRSIAHGFFARGHEPDDLLQEARLACLEALRAHDPARGTEPSFVRLVVTRRLIEVVQSANCHTHRVLTDSSRFEHPGFDLVERGSDPAEQVEHRLELEEILRRAERLTVRERRALALHLLGYSYAEIAGVPAGHRPSVRSVDNALTRGRRKLRA